jgi:hypothetical protein
MTFCNVKWGMEHSRVESVMSLSDARREDNTVNSRGIDYPQVPGKTRLPGPC